MGLKERLLQLKEKLKITTDELSLKSGVPAGTINKILNGETPNPRLATSKALARALGCTLDYLTGEADEVNGQRKNDLGPYLQAASTPLEDIIKLSQEDLDEINEIIEMKIRKHIAKSGKPDTEK